MKRQREEGMGGIAAYQDGVGVGPLCAQPLWIVVGTADEVPSEEVHRRPLPLHGCHQAVLKQGEVELALHVLHLLREVVRVLLLLELHKGAGKDRTRRRAQALCVREVVPMLLHLQQGAEKARDRNQIHSSADATSSRNEPSGWANRSQADGTAKVICSLPHTTGMPPYLLFGLAWLQDDAADARPSHLQWLLTTPRDRYQAQHSA